MAKSSSKQGKLRGIISHGTYIPHWYLERSEIAAALGVAAGKGVRRVAGFDEDTTTMGVAAGKQALRASEELKDTISDLWYSTAEPAYLEKTNATAIHSALLLEQSAGALDFGGASRSGIGALRNALKLDDGNQLVILSGLRTGMPASSDESMGGDGAAAFVVGSGEDVIAEYVSSGSATQEFIDRWREPSQPHSQQWEERFAEQAYEPLFEVALEQALGKNLKLEDIDSVAVVGTHLRSAKKIANRFSSEQLVGDFLDEVGNTGAAHPGLVLSAMLSDAKPDSVVAVVWLADGVEILIFKTTKAIGKFSELKTSAKTLPAQIQKGSPIQYTRYLRWRKIIKTQPPNRPEPPRISAPAAFRSGEWKHGLVDTLGVTTNDADLPIVPEALADKKAKIVTYTIDRLVYSENPPVIFAIVDFITDTDGKPVGRFAVELTDVSESELEIGLEVEMTFRKLYTSEGIHNYFYKAQPVR